LSRAATAGTRVYGWIGAIGGLSFLLLAWRQPAGLSGAPVDLKTWAELARNGMVMRLLAIITLQMSGQFVAFTFMGPLLAKLTAAGPEKIGLVFAVYGLCGFVGIAIATCIVDSWGAYKT
jgi:MFS transporter, DHA1 family, inner membrane transport protein